MRPQESRRELRFCCSIFQMLFIYARLEKNCSHGYERYFVLGWNKSWCICYQWTRERERERQRERRVTLQSAPRGSNWRADNLCLGLARSRSLSRSLLLSLSFSLDLALVSWSQEEDEGGGEWEEPRGWETRAEGQEAQNGASRSYATVPRWGKFRSFWDINNSLSHQLGSEWSERSERANKWAVRVNERTDERVAQYLRPNFWLFCPTVRSRSWPWLLQIQRNPAIAQRTRL